MRLNMKSILPGPVGAMVEVGPIEPFHPTRAGVPGA